MPKIAKKSSFLDWQKCSKDNAHLYTDDDLSDIIEGRKLARDYALKVNARDSAERIDKTIRELSQELLSRRVVIVLRP